MVNRGRVARIKKPGGEKRAWKRATTSRGEARRGEAAKIATSSPLQVLRLGLSLHTLLEIIASRSVSWATSKLTSAARLAAVASQIEKGIIPSHCAPLPRAHVSSRLVSSAGRCTIRREG